MLKNLSLPFKVFIIFFPLFFVAVAVISYFNYSATQEQMMSQVQNAATAQANTIKEALVNMMVTNESVDDSYLRKVSSSGDIKDIHILFRLDSLHFDEEFLEDDARRTRLIRREVDVWDLNKNFGTEVFHTKEPQWFLTCNKKLHETKVISNLSVDKPAFLQSCEEIQALIPFVAEKKCQRCHNVELNSVLGAAVMSVPLAQTAAHLKENALRSLYVFVGFLVLSLVLNGLVFRKFINNPLKKLIGITDAIGNGKLLDHKLKDDFDNDEIGKLAVAFDHMQENLNRVQKELVKNERLSAVGQMASSIVHDFRTPMASVSLIADYLQKHQVMEPEPRIKKFEQLHSAIRRMDDMMQELLDFSKGGFQLNYVECTAESIAESLQQDYESHFKEGNIRFAVSNHSIGPITVDKDRIRRVLNNLINNAEDAMPNGGVISVLLEDANEQLKCSVEDTGSGIPIEIRDSLFEPFVTYGKKNGTGLGLAIVRKVIEHHGGTITFTSETGKGTEFVIVLPRLHTI
ncbi:MAG: HAMP domain-containing sensor histidine kinase [Bacteriovoracaceae bacterium]|nr:HAMP domain-containing histidine kinase [Bacteroidota bacterium]